ncbi:MAG: serine acetyltransferase [Clostridiaceae bacterium]|nr:serine acetyltransferase [Clostridiaceae bacterium]
MKMLSIKSLIKSDFKNHTAYKRTKKQGMTRLKSYALFISLFIMDTGFRGIVLYRICHFNCKHSKYRVYISYLFFKLLTSIEISPRAIIGPGLFFPHTLCIVIGQASLGDNCTIYNGVTIGAKLPFHDKYPEIGNDVYIGAGSTILGDIKVGNNVTIGAKTLVLKDIPDNSVVAGIPAEIMKKVV